MYAICILMVITHIKTSEQKCILNKADNIQNYRKTFTKYIPEALEWPILDRDEYIANNISNASKLPQESRFGYTKKLTRTRGRKRLRKRMNSRSHRKERLRIFRFLKNTTHVSRRYVIDKRGDTRRQAEVVESTTMSASKEMAEIIADMDREVKTEATTNFMQKYSTSTTTESVRTTISRVWLNETCDYVAYYCMKAYKTGRVCARTQHWLHYTFQNYCMLDYVNCVEGFDIWHIIHMGPCFDVGDWTDFNYYEPKKGDFLYQDLAVPALFETQFGLRDY